MASVELGRVEEGVNTMLKGYKLDPSDQKLNATLSRLLNDLASLAVKSGRYSLFAARYLVAMIVSIAIQATCFIIGAYDRCLLLPE